MGAKVAVDDLLDVRGVADILGLAQPNSVSTYLHRYDDFPRPVFDSGSGRVRLWLRPKVLSWARSHGSKSQARKEGS